jgi:DNA-binding CsgD family transcriptional regulator
LQVIATKKRMVALDIQEYAAGWKVVIAEKNPIIDNHKNVTAIHSHLIEVTEVQMFRGILLLTEMDKKFDANKLKPKSYILTDAYCPLPLTDKQINCMFYLVRGKSYKEIAKLLSISFRTVEGHMDAIKYKLNCYSKSALIEKAVDSGFIFFIPSHLQKNIVMGYENH